MKRKSFMIALLLAAALLAGCASKADTPDAPAALSDPPGLVLDAAALTEAPTFIDWDQDGVAMQLIVLKDAQGQVRLAFNTCQSCGGSPYAWFEDLGDGNLQCQNCGLTFPLDTVGTERAQGCNPVTISEFTQEGDAVTVPAAVLAENAPRFANWKKLD